VTQAPVSAADAELGEVVLSAGEVVLLAGEVADDDDAAPGAAWLAHAVTPSPHAATAKKAKVTERSRTT
jgi:hypothetical protein